MRGGQRPNKPRPVQSPDLPMLRYREVQRSAIRASDRLADGGAVE